MEPPYGIYACKSGHLAMAQTDLNLLADVLELPVLRELKASRPPQSDTDAVATWRDAIYDAVAGRLKQEPNSYWDELLTAHGIWCGVVNDYAAFLAHPQTQRYLTTMRHSTGGSYRTVAPAIRFSETSEPALRGSPHYGEHSREVLLEAGFSPADIDALLEAKAVVAR